MMRIIVTMKTIAILLVVAVAAQAASFMDPVKQEWDVFKVQFAKKYNNKVEERLRMKVYMNNKLLIDRHNKNYEQGKVSFKMEMNQFGDWLHEEFVRTMNGFRGNLSEIETRNDHLSYLPPYNVTLPDTFDWRLAGAVTPVKNQGSCGSCWAFSATGALEGQYFRKTGRLVSLSEQNLMDCSSGYGNHGCGGGFEDNAFHYIADNHGIDTEQAYPYETRVGPCRYNPYAAVMGNRNYVDLPKGDEGALKAAVATVGPISVLIDASHKSFQFYKSGVYYEAGCNPTALDHAVLAVGYGTENGQDYWLVKNSWDTWWGMQGYVKMARNRNNNCGIVSWPSYPVF